MRGNLRRIEEKEISVYEALQVHCRIIGELGGNKNLVTGYLRKQGVIPKRGIFKGIEEVKERFEVNSNRVYTLIYSIPEWP